MQAIASYRKLVRPIANYWRLLQAMASYRQLLPAVAAFRKMLQGIAGYGKLSQAITGYCKLSQAIAICDLVQLLHRTAQKVLHNKDLVQILRTGTVCPSCTEPFPLA